MKKVKATIFKDDWNKLVDFLNHIQERHNALVDQFEELKAQSSIRYIKADAGDIESFRLERPSLESRIETIKQEAIQKIKDLTV